MPFPFKANSFMSLQDCMKGSLAKARVLYVPVEEIGSEGRLLHACRIQMLSFITKRKNFMSFSVDWSCFCHLKKLFWISWDFLEVIIDAYTEAGLVLERDANHKLQV